MRRRPETLVAKSSKKFRPGKPRLQATIRYFVLQRGPILQPTEVAANYLQPAEKAPKAGGRCVVIMYGGSMKVEMVIIVVKASDWLMVQRFRR